jgi:hypothetical protein
LWSGELWSLHITANVSINDVLVFLIRNAGTGNMS